MRGPVTSSASLSEDAVLSVTPVPQMRGRAGLVRAGLPPGCESRPVTRPHGPSTSRRACVGPPPRRGELL